MQCSQRSLAAAGLVLALLSAAASPGARSQETGIRRLALVVGVGSYLQPKLPDLQGPVLDARAVHRLLTAPGGYGFAPEDVVLLLDEQATVEGFRRAFRTTLIDRARQGDVALLYYAGHGSQVRDESGDEPDGWDESLLLHDSRTESATDLLDDELNGLLEALHAKTRNITVVLDSCSSGTATREGVWAIPRLVPRDDRPGPSARPRGPRVELESGDGNATGWSPRSLPGLVVLSAARDGTPALEPDEGGHGFFTSAFLDVLGAPSSTPLTWAQVARRMPRIVAALSNNRQLPTFQGSLERYAFDGRDRRRPFGWEVSEIASSIELRGVDLPGWGVGALVRVYPGEAQLGETTDPLSARATLRIDRYDGLGASASPVDRASSPIEIGDLATLLLPSPDSLRLRVRLTPSGMPGGLGEDELSALTRALTEDPAAAQMLRLTDESDVLTIRRGDHGELRTYGPEGVLRNTFHGSFEDRVEDAVRSLEQHARQTSLLMLEGEGGSDFANDRTLEVRLVPRASANTDRPAVWVQAPANGEQRIPVGARWQIEVTNTDDETTLLVGGAVLWNDGGIGGLPFAGDEVRLPPKKTVILDPAAAFEAVPPLDALEHVVIFGTREDNPVHWNLLTDPAAGTRRSEGGGPLQHLLAAYLDGARAGRRLEVAPSTWTSSHVSFRTVDDP